MTYVAIVDATPEGRLAKFAEFETLPEAEAHAAEFGGFALGRPAMPDGNWLIDMTAKTITDSPPPPPDFSAIDQEAVDRLLLDRGVMRALAQALFQIANDVRVLQGQGTITAGQFKTFLKGLIR